MVDLSITIVEFPLTIIENISMSESVFSSVRSVNPKVILGENSKLRIACIIRNISLPLNTIFTS